MERRLSIVLVGLLAVGALVVVMTGTVLAQEETPEQAPKAFGWHMRGHGFSFGRGFGGQVGLEAAAAALGMSADELSTQLWGGSTLADLAEKAGVDLQDVQDTVTAANEAAMRDAIEQAVQDGNLSRAHADWLLEGLEQGYLGGGFGGYHGFRGPGMRGRFGGAGFGGFGHFPRRNSRAGVSDA